RRSELRALAVSRGVVPGVQRAAVCFRRLFPNPMPCSAGPAVRPFPFAFYRERWLTWRGASPRATRFGSGERERSLFRRQLTQLDRHAAVHDHLQAGLPSSLRSLKVFDTQLQPDGFGADLNRLIDDVGHELRSPEDVHHVDGQGDARQVRIGWLIEDLTLLGIDRDDPVSLLLQITRHRVARSRWIMRQPDDCHRVGGSQDTSRIVVLPLHADTGIPLRLLGCPVAASLAAAVGQLGLLVLLAVADVPPFAGNEEAVDGYLLREPLDVMAGRIHVPALAVIALDQGQMLALPEVDGRGGKRCPGVLGLLFEVDDTLV